MNQVIYYPTFEVGDPQWLKFALLYLDKLDPIIPEAGDPHLSDRFQRLQGETDLIEVHRPDRDEGTAATLDTIEHVEKILRNPERYESVFQETGFLENWKAPQKQTARLFEAKYTDVWKNFCLQNNLGRKTDEGLLVNEDLCDLYMTLLAHVIADGRGISPITDYPRLDRFAVFTRRSVASDSATVETAQAVIDLQLPANLSEISIESIISHRNRPGFKERQRAFHKELNSFMAEAEKHTHASEFPEALGSAWSDFRDDILRIGTGAAGFGLGVWLLLGSGPVETLKAATQMAGGLSLAVGSSLTIKNTWRNTQTKRWTRKYLADLKRLDPK